MKLTKKEVESHREGCIWMGEAGLTRKRDLCDDWLAMQAMLKKVSKLFDEGSTPTQIAYLNGKLKELLK